MQQLDAFCLHFDAIRTQDVQKKAAQVAHAMGLSLEGISQGADVWYALMPHPLGAIQLHYDWLGECFWLTPTGQLAEQPELWQKLKKKVNG